VDMIVTTTEYEDSFWNTVEEYLFDYLVSTFTGNYMYIEKQSKPKDRKKQLGRTPSQSRDITNKSCLSHISSITFKEQYMSNYAILFSTVFTEREPFKDHEAILTFKHVPRAVFDIVFCSQLTQLVEEENKLISKIETIPGVREVFGKWYRKDSSWVIVPPATITWDGDTNILTLQLYYNSL